MDKNLLKGFVLGSLISGFIIYRYFENRIKVNENSFDKQLKALQGEIGGQKQLNDNEEIAYLKLGDSCELIETFKNSLNYLIGNETFDKNNIYTEDLKTDLSKILAGTSNVINDNGDLRKSFIYDINKTIANVVGRDIEVRKYLNEYDGGIVSKGAKGQDVKNLQSLVNKLYDKKEEDIEITGTFNKDTYSKTKQLFLKTTALIDMDTGAISKEFISNFNTILTNINY